MTHCSGPATFGGSVGDLGFFAGGGGDRDNGPNGSGGMGGGGNGRSGDSVSINGFPGDPNTGGGGLGDVPDPDGTGGAGGSGVVILRYLLEDPGDTLAIGGIYSVEKIAGLDYGLHVFENSGTFEVLDTVQVPEPHSIAIWGMLGLLGVGYGVWRRKKS